MLKRINLGPNTFIKGYTVGDELVFTSYVILFGSLLTFLFGGWIFGFVLLILGGLMCTTFDIFVVNKAENYYFNGFLLMGYFKIGKKYDMSQYPHITMLRRGYGGENRYAFGGGAQASEYRYELYLLSETHLSRMLVREYWDREIAQEKMEKLAEATGVEIVKYNPRRRR